MLANSRVTASARERNGGMKITSKKQFYELAQNALCGNTPRVWTDRFELDRDYDNGRGGLPKLFRLRTLKPGDPRGTSRDVNFYNAYINLAFQPGVFCVSEFPPPGAETGPLLQGELSWVNGEWWLYYTHAPGYMRTVLPATGRHLRGWAAIRLLRGHLTPSDFDTLMELFDRYTEDTDYPVVEFGNYRRPWGRLNRNLIIWEIRNGY